jgi:hypothetical protein
MCREITSHCFENGGLALCNGETLLARAFEVSLARSHHGIHVEGSTIAGNHMGDAPQPKRPSVLARSVVPTPIPSAERGGIGILQVIFPDVTSWPVSLEKQGSYAGVS